MNTAAHATSTTNTPMNHSSSAALLENGNGLDPFCPQQKSRFFHHGATMDCRDFCFLGASVTKITQTHKRNLSHHVTQSLSLTTPMDVWQSSDTHCQTDGAFGGGMTTLASLIVPTGQRPPRDD